MGSLSRGDSARRTLPRLAVVGLVLGVVLAFGVAAPASATGPGASVAAPASATRPGASAPASAALTAAPAPALKTLTAPIPTIPGAATLGRVLTVAAGTWGPGAVTLTYRWNRDGVAIAGATTGSHTVVAADVGATLSVTVKGTKSGYTPATVTSAPTPPVPNGSLLATPVPTITGTLAIGSPLTARAGSWTPSPVTLSYQWLRAGKPIVGAVGSRYTVALADSGQQLAVAVTGAKAGYTGVTSTSRALAAIPVISLAAPTLSGTPALGQTLASAVPAYSPAGVGLFYSWFRDGRAIPGATQRTYVVSAADLGAHLGITVSASKTGYAPLSMSSAPTVEVYDATPLSGPLPAVTGGTTIGATLTVDVGTWSPTPDAFTHQWYRDGLELPGATSGSYTLTANDAGRAVTVAVTAQRARVQSVRLLSLPVTIGADERGYDIIAILGQSNAQGAGLEFDPALDAPMVGLDQFPGSGPSAGKVIPAVDSLFHTNQWLSPTGTPRVGPGMQFGRELLATEPVDRRVLLVPAAQRGTSISGDAALTWDPSNSTARTNLYKRALAQIDGALASGPGNRLVAIVWAQGESDIAIMTGDAYEAKLLEIVDGLRARYGTVPVLIGGMVPEWRAEHPVTSEIEGALAAVAGERDDVAYVPGVVGFAQEDPVHYTSAGARMMGHLYYTAYRSLRPTG